MPAPKYRVKLSDPEHWYFDDDVRYSVKGNAVVEFDEPNPTRLAAIQAGKLVLTDEPVQPNTYRPTGHALEPVKASWDKPDPLSYADVPALSSVPVQEPIQATWDKPGEGGEGVGAEAEASSAGGEASAEDTEGADNAAGGQVGEKADTGPQTEETEPKKPETPSPAPTAPTASAVPASTVEAGQRLGPTAPTTPVHPGRTGSTRHPAKARGTTSARK